MFLLRRIVLNERHETEPLYVEVEDEEAMRLCETGRYRLASPKEQETYTREKHTASALVERKER